MSMDDISNVTPEELAELKRIHVDLENLFKCPVIDGIVYCGSCIWYYEYMCAKERIAGLIESIEDYNARNGADA